MSLDDDIQKFWDNIENSELSGDSADDEQEERSAHESDEVVDQDSESDTVNEQQPLTPEEEARQKQQEHFEKYGKVITQLAAEGWEAIENQDWGTVNLLYSSISKTAENLMLLSKQQFIDDLNDRFFPETRE